MPKQAQPQLRRNPLPVITIAASPKAGYDAPDISGGWGDGQQPGVAARFTPDLMPREPIDVSDSTLRLLTAGGVGPATLNRLRTHLGDDDAIVGVSPNELQSVPGIGRATAARLYRAIGDADPEAERRRMADHATGMILAGDGDYPALLAAIPDEPPALWIRGELRPEDRLALAIVGSRRCTAYGREQSGRFSALLAESGLTIVSGGALGIDGEAHRGALRAGGRTIAVLGCGLSHPYPPEHARLFRRITESGAAIVSEYPMATRPLARHFPRRNRIISGLSLGVLVIEAAPRSGALITARCAGEDHGREVMCLPGRVDSPASRGALSAVRDGWAGLVLDHADVLNQLDASSHLVRGALEAAGQVGASSSASLFDHQLSVGQRQIVDVLREAGERLLPDEIAARTRLPLSQLLAEITILEIRGQVRKDERGIELKR